MKKIVDKCKEESKLFYRFINGKIKPKEIITRLKKHNEVYEDLKEMSEVLNENLKKIFTTESDFQKPQGQVRKNEMREIKISQKEIEEMMKELDERKAIGLDAGSGYILKECRQEIAEPFHDIIECSIKTEKVPKEWKRADIMPIYKNGKKRTTSL